MEKTSGLLFAFSGNHYKFLCTSSQHLYQLCLGADIRCEGRAVQRKRVTEVSSSLQNAHASKLEATSVWFSITLLRAGRGGGARDSDSVRILSTSPTEG